MIDLDPNFKSQTSDLRFQSLKENRPAFTGRLIRIFSCAKTRSPPVIHGRRGRRRDALHRTHRQNYISAGGAGQFSQTRDAVFHR
jgi:hypothetical protein